MFVEVVERVKTTFMAIKKVQGFLEKIKNYAELTTIIFFIKTRFPKSGLTYRRQVVNPIHQTPHFSQQLWNWIQNQWLNYRLLLFQCCPIAFPMDTYNGCHHHRGAEMERNGPPNCFVGCFNNIHKLLTYVRALKIATLYKKCIFQCMGKICFWNVPWTHLGMRSETSTEHNRCWVMVTHFEGHYCQISL